MTIYRFGTDVHPITGYRFGSDEWTSLIQAEIGSANQSIRQAIKPSIKSAIRLYDSTVTAPPPAVVNNGWMSLLDSVQGTFAGAGTTQVQTFSDYSWSAQATGARKSAQAGYIDPVYFANAQNHKGAAIFEVSAAGAVDFYVERVLGETGSISTTITTFEVLTGGARSGTHYSPVSQVVTFSDGEIGWKKVTVNVTSIPTGFGIIGLKLSNYIPDGTGTARNEYCYIWLQGTGTVAGAKHLLSLGAGVESNGNTAGDGSAGNPWRSPSYAATQMGNSGGVLYVSDANGAYQDSGANKSSTAYGGSFIFENLCTVTNPLIVLPNPSNTGRPVFDNGLGRNYVDSGGATQYSEYLGKKGGIMCGRFASHIWMVGLDSLHGGIGAYPDYYNYVHHIVLWKVKSQWVAAEGSNVHNIKFDSSYDCIFDSCFATEAYTYQSTDVSIWPSATAPYQGTVIPMNLNGAIQSYHSYGMRVIGCTTDNSVYGLMQKNAPGGQGVNVGYFGYTIKHCLFKRVKGCAVWLTNAGGGSPPTLKIVVGYCVNEGNARNGTGGKVNLVGIYMDGPASAQSDRIDVYNCITRLNGYIGNLDGDHVRYFNNISEESSFQWGSQGNGAFLSRLEYGDHCLYVNGTKTWRTHLYNGPVNYTTLAAWQSVNKVGSGVTDDQVLMQEPDKNSTETATVPAYTNAAAYDYRWTNALGYAGKPVGLGHMKAGVDW